MSADKEANSNWFAKIVKWNKERGLLESPYVHRREMSFILEEIIESNGSISSEDARINAEFWAEEIADEDPSNIELIVDSYADIIVFATGAIRKLGYDPDKVSIEVLKAINSRTGKIVDGKFVKDLDAIRYEPDYSTCRIKTED